LYSWVKFRRVATLCPPLQSAAVYDLVSTRSGTVQFAVLAVGRLTEDRPGWSIRKFVRTTRRYHTVQIRAGQHLLTAEDPLPDDLRDALTLITAPEDVH
jgi:hypothetical protein